MSIYVKLMEVQQKLKANKGQYNSFGKYSYRSCEDILEALKPQLKKNGLALVLTDEVVAILDRIYVKATAKLIDTETGENINVSASAREELSKKGMDGSQITGTASSYARKYALNGMFAIDDNKDSDATNTHGKGDSKPQGGNSKPKATGGTNEAQIKRLYAIANNAGITPQIVFETCKKNYKVTKLEDLTKVQYDEVCGRLEAKAKK